MTPTFDRLAEVTIGFLEQLGVERYVLYMFDFGAPVGMRMATSFPERIAGLVSQNGNIALEGLGDPLGPLAEWWGDREAHQATVDQFLSAESTRMQWAAGLRDDDSLDPAPVALDVALLADPARRAIAEALLWDYQTNPGLYPAWQAWLSEHRPPTLAIWGARDPFFTPAGAEAYRSANPEAEVVRLDANAVPGSARLTVRISPSVGAAPACGPTPEATRTNLERVPPFHRPRRRGHDGGVPRCATGG